METCTAYLEDVMKTSCTPCLEAGMDTVGDLCSTPGGGDEFRVMHVQHVWRMR